MKAAKAVDAGNAAGLAVSSRFAAPPLRSGPSGDTASPAAQRSMTTGRVLPVVTDRLFDDGHPTVFEDRLTRRNPEGGFDSPRASNPSECTLFRPSGCPENQDHLEPRVGTLFRGGCPDAGAMPRCRPRTGLRPSSGPAWKADVPTGVHAAVGAPSGDHVRSCASSVLASTTSLRMTAVSATFGGLPRVVSSWYLRARSGLCWLALSAAM